MFEDIKDFFKDLVKNLITSRLFVLLVLFGFMFCALVVRLFHLQIISGEKYQDAYTSLTEKVIHTDSTRGNIYDRNGNVLAYNKLANSVTVQDIGAFKKDAQWNAMLYELVNILNKHGETVQGNLELTIDHNGEIAYTCKSELAKKQFLRDYYGLKNVNQLDDPKGSYPSDITARQLFDRLKKKDYKLDDTKDKDGNPLSIPDDVALQILNIRYTMRFTAFQKYETTTVASGVSDETVADVLEHTADLPGVDIAQSTVRVYNDSIYFAPVIGYTGMATNDQLEDLQKSDPDYEPSDVVGTTGIEQSQELKLHGKKGSQTVYVDNMGRVMQVANQVAPVAGDDIWLSLDSNLQKGIYLILEKQLAGILVNTIKNKDKSEIKYTDSSSIEIPIKDAYFQLINNNVLSYEAFASDEASDGEKQINAKYLSARDQALSNLKTELMSDQARPMNELPEDLQAYMKYIYKFLSDDKKAQVIKSKQIDNSSPEYQAWDKGAISLRAYLYYGIASNWIDTTKLSIQSKYSNADDTYEALVNFIFDSLSQDDEFNKLIYRYLIDQNVVTGKELCLALYDQNVLAYDEGEVEKLRQGDENYTYQFLISKIRSVEITPAQLALEPCTASCVVTDVKTGKVLALVSYPSYDNNRISEPGYLAKLSSDQSLPLRNNATQTLKAPGSTFKPITAVAALQEGVIKPDEIIDCTGEFDKVAPPVRCWKYPGSHGPLNVVGGIENSCNFFFSELAYRLSTKEDGTYSPEQGIEILRKYATMFGLDQRSGVEILESEPKISDTDPERSAMGQGTHSYANVQLARYVTALANRGTVFDLSLLDKETDSKGNLVKQFEPKIHAQLDIAPLTWDLVQQGMRQVITNSSSNRIFKDLEVNIAGKTGTAQESKKQGNHAFFVSFAPYENPEIVVTVNIPNGYSSSNAAIAAKHVYRYYYGYTTLDDIMNAGALDASNQRINGD